VLSESLKGVVAQILLKRIGGGRVAAYEILLGIRPSAMIREGDGPIPTINADEQRLGMRNMNESLGELVRAGKSGRRERFQDVDKDGLRMLLNWSDGATVGGSGFDRPPKRSRFRGGRGQSRRSAAGGKAYANHDILRRSGARLRTFT